MPLLHDEQLRRETAPDRQLVEFGVARSAVPALAMHHDLDPARFIAPRRRVLYDVVVDPAHRGVGIGRQLLDATLAELKTGGASRVVLSTAERNAASRVNATSVRAQRARGIQSRCAHRRNGARDCSDDHEQGDDTRIRGGIESRHAEQHDDNRLARYNGSGKP